MFDRLNDDSLRGTGPELLIDRESVFASAYNQIMRLEEGELRRTIDVKFTKSSSRGPGMLKALIQ